MRKIHYAAVVVGAVTLAAAGSAMMTPLAGRIIVENVSPSMDLGWYVRTKDEIEVGSVVVFTLPETARSMAEERGIRMDIPIMKRVVDIADGLVTVEGDYGEDRSFDSTYYGPVPVENMAGVYRRIEW